MKRRITNFVIKYKALLNEYKRVDFIYIFDLKAVLNSLLVFVLMESIFIGFSYLVKMNANLTYLFLTTSSALLGSLLLYHYKMLVKYDIKERKVSTQFQTMKFILMQVLFFLYFTYIFRLELISTFTIIIFSFVALVLTIAIIYLDANTVEPKNQVFLRILFNAFMYYIAFSSMVYLVGFKNPIFVMVIYSSVIMLFEIFRLFIQKLWSFKTLKIVGLLGLSVGFYFVANEASSYRNNELYLIFNRYISGQVFMSEGVIENQADIPIELGFDYENYLYYEYRQETFGNQVRADKELLDYQVLEQDGKYIFVHVYHDMVSKVPIDGETDINQTEYINEESWVLVYDMELNHLKTYYFENTEVAVKEINESVYVFVKNEELNDENNSSIVEIRVFNGIDLKKTDVLGSETYIMNFEYMEDRDFFFEDNTLYASIGQISSRGLFVLDPNTTLYESVRITGKNTAVSTDNAIIYEDYEIWNNDTGFVIENGITKYYTGSVFSYFNLGQLSNLRDDDKILYLTSHHENWNIRGYLYDYQEYLNTNIHGSHYLLFDEEIMTDDIRMEIIENYMYVQTGSRIDKYDLNLKLISSITGYNNDITNDNVHLLESVVISIENESINVLSLEKVSNKEFNYDGEAICNPLNYVSTNPPKCYTSSFGALQLSYGLLLFLVVKRKSILIS